MKKNKDVFENIIIHRLEAVKNTLIKKNKEYGTEDNHYHNFVNAGRVLNITKENALLGMMVKHLVSVLDIVSQEEDIPIRKDVIEEKFTDLIAYLILLEGMLYKYRDIQENTNEEIY